MTKRQKQNQERSAHQQELQLRALNDAPVRFMDAQGEQPVYFGDKRYETAPFQQLFVKL